MPHPATRTVWAARTHTAPVDGHGHAKTAFHTEGVNP